MGGGFRAPVSARRFFNFHFGGVETGSITVCATRSATVGTPSTRTPPAFFGIGDRRRKIAAGAPPIPKLVQLVTQAFFESFHAFAIGMAARDWPPEAMHSVVLDGLTSEHIGVERDAARRSLTAALPVETRTLLYRLSLTIGHFDRALALGIGSISPAIPRVGERLDEHVGPWIEAVGNGRFRVSPLASNAGREMLAPDEQRSVHSLITIGESFGLR